MFRTCTRITSLKRLKFHNRPSTVQNPRYFSLPPSKAEDTPEIKQNPYSREFPSTLQQVAHLVRRIFKYSIVGVLSIGSAGLVLFYGTHFYVEKVSLAPKYLVSGSHGPELIHYEWDQELENWTGPMDIGGTNPKLSWKTRQAIRSAWMSLNWGSGLATVPTEGITTNDGRLVPALRYLQMALQSSPDQHTRTALLELQAGVASAINSVQSLQYAKSCFEIALQDPSLTSLRAARLSSRMADVQVRLGEIDQAINACHNSVSAITGEQPPAETSAIFQKSNSPAGNRLLLRNMVTLSALYASSQQLQTTCSFQKAALELAKSMTIPLDSSSSPPSLVHNLFVQQRIATLQIHHAEVVYAVVKKNTEPFDLLSQAAATSEGVVLALTGKDDSLLAQPEPPPPLQPRNEITSIAALSQPASALLLDASRSAATAHRLLGLLYEKQGKQNAEDALFHLEKALWWCGGVEGPAPSIPLTEWEIIWNDYKRLRNSIYPNAT